MRYLVVAALCSVTNVFAAPYYFSCYMPCTLVLLSSYGLYVPNHLLEDSAAACSNGSHEVCSAVKYKLWMETYCGEGTACFDAANEIMEAWILEETTFFQ